MPGNPRAKFAITADNSQYRRTLKKSLRDTKTFAGSVRGALKTGAVAGAAAVGALTFKLASLTKEAAANADALAKQSDLLGISTQKLAAYQLAARLSGSSNEGFSKGILKVQKAIVDATNGLTTYTRAFDALKLDPQDLKQLAPDEQFEALAKAMVGVENQTERVALAYDLFGGRNTALLNTLVLTGEQLEKIEADTKAWGVAISRVDAKKIENANDAVERAQTALQGIGTSFALAFAPLREQVANSFADAAAESNGFRTEIDETMRLVVLASNFAANSVRGIALAFNIAKLAVLEVRETLAELSTSNVITAAAAVPSPLQAFAQGIQDAGGDLGVIRDNMDATGQKVDELVAKFITGDEALANYVAAVEEATAAAQGQVDAAGGLAGGATGDTSDGGSNPETDKLQEQLAKRLEALRAAQRSEQELIFQAAEEKFVFLDELYERQQEVFGREILAFEEKENLKNEIAEQANERLIEIERRRMQEQQALEARHTSVMVNLRAAMVDTTIGLLATLGQRSKTLQRAAILAEKAIAVTRIIVHTNEAAALAVAQLGPVLGPPAAASITAWGYGLAAATAALGVAQAAGVGGGGGPSVGGSGGEIGPVSESIDGPGSQEFESQQARNVVNLTIAGSVLSGQDTLDSLKRWIKDLTDADEIVISGNSRQAQELRG